MSAITMIDATEPLEPVDWDRTQTSAFWSCLRRRKTRRGWPHIPDDTVLAMRQRYAEGQVTQQQLADEYGVHRLTVHNLLKTPAVAGEGETPS